MPNPGFLLAEDAAVKARFSGMTVTDDKNAARPVQVFFRYPEGDTERTYPFITIEMIDIVHALDRQHSEVQLYASTSGAASLQYTGPNALQSGLASTIILHNLLRLLLWLPPMNLYQ